MKKMSILVFIAAVAWANIAGAATYYVATTGSNTTGNGTTQKPWKTIGYGMGKMVSGDTLIIKRGIYYDKENFINSRLAKVPSGAAGNYTVIRSEEPMTVRIKNSGALNYYDNMLRLEGDYIRVDGFIFDMTNTAYPENNASVEGNYNKITRSIFRRQGNVDPYGGWLYIGGNYNLVEDVAGVGAARYGFGTGGPDSTASYNIFRRVVGRVDYSNSTQPKATFVVYGNNSGYGVHDVLLQNCIAIDGRRGPSSAEQTYGGFYFPKNATNVTIQGSIVLHNEAAHAGFFVKELSGNNIKLEHSVAWDVYGTSDIAGIRAGGSKGPLTLNHVTAGGSPIGYSSNSSDVRVMTNSLFYGNSGLFSSSYGWDTQSYNAFNPADQSQGNNAVTKNVALKYILRSEVGSGQDNLANDGTDIGADVTAQYGVSGTLWGEPGFDRRTNVPLWPWAYEGVIKEIFSEPNNPPAGNVPASNDTKRGFCAAQDAFGQPMTLTRYIWQYLGNQIPGDIYAPPQQLDKPAVVLGK